MRRRYFNVERWFTRHQHSTMPRIQRLCVPGIPLHIVQRGNNKQPCFLQTSDYLAYLEAMKHAAARYEADVHAYVLMTNHVHLLVTPHDSESASKMMQHIGRKYVQRFNDEHKRTGTLWEGRFRSSIVDSEKYLLACYRYIELNPVRAGIVAVPDQYPWSSYRVNALGRADELITPRVEWLDLGACMAERCQRYRRLFDAESISDDLELFRSSVRKGLPAGTQRFRNEIGAKLNVKIGDGKRGRPSKEKGL